MNSEAAAGQPAPAATAPQEGDPPAPGGEGGGAGAEQPSTPAKEAKEVSGAQGSNSEEDEGEEEKNETKLFIGNLPMQVDEEGLRNVAAVHGAVEEVMLMYRTSPSGDRCGFVRYSNSEEAKRAKIELSKQAYPGGRSLMVVRYADRSKPRSKGGDSCKLFVGNLPPSTNDTDLWTLFAEHGSVMEVILLRKPSLSGCRCAFIRYSKSSSAVDAINKLNGVGPFPGNEQFALVVRVADPPKSDQPASPTAPAGRGYSQQAGFSNSPPQEQVQLVEGKIFVTGLPEGITNSEVAELFSPHGPVLSAEVKDSSEAEGTSAFIHFSRPSDAERAKSTIHEKSYCGRKLRVTSSVSAAGGSDRQRPMMQPAYSAIDAYQNTGEYYPQDQYGYAQQQGWEGYGQADQMGMGLQQDFQQQHAALLRGQMPYASGMDYTGVAVDGSASVGYDGSHFEGQQFPFQGQGAGGFQV